MQHRLDGALDNRVALAGCLRIKCQGRHDETGQDTGQSRPLRLVHAGKGMQIKPQFHIQGAYIMQAVRLPAQDFQPTSRIPHDDRVLARHLADIGQYPLGQTGLHPGRTSFSTVIRISGVKSISKSGSAMRSPYRALNPRRAEPALSIPAFFAFSRPDSLPDRISGRTESPAPPLPAFSPAGPCASGVSGAAEPLPEA